MSHRLAITDQLEKLDAMTESPKMKDALLKSVRDQIEKLEEIGPFLIITVIAAAVNGTSYSFCDTAPDCMLAFALTFFTLGDEAPAADF